jgi:hypothetical protein
MHLSQDVFNNYLIIKLQKNNSRVLNMLNVKYVIQTDKEGKRVSNDWNQMQMVTLGCKRCKIVNNKANDEMKLLDQTIPKKAAIFNVLIWC